MIKDCLARMVKTDTMDTTDRMVLRETEVISALKVTREMPV